MFPGYDKNFSRKLKINNLMEIVDDVDDYVVLDINNTINLNISDYLNMGDLKHKYISETYIDEIVNNELMKYFEKREEEYIYFRLVSDKMRTQEYISDSLISKLDITINFDDDKYIIVNGNIGSEIMSLPKFSQFDGEIISHSTYLIVKYDGINVYVNPYLRWDRNIMLVFDDTDFYSYSDYKLVPYTHASFVMSSDISFKIYIKKNVRFDLYEFVDLDDQEIRTSNVQYF